MSETTITVLNGVCWFSSDVRKDIHRVQSLMAETGEGTVLANPEMNDGCLYAKIPAEWIHIGKKRTVSLTEEQKAERSERLRKARSGK